MVRARTRLLTTGFATLVLLAWGGLLTGCQTAPVPSVRNTVALSIPAETVGDVAVTAPTSGGAMGTALREELYRGLIARGYSVLDLSFVDGGGRGSTVLLTSVAAGPTVTGVRTALYDQGGTMVYESSVAAPKGTASPGALAELLLRDLPVR